MVCYLVWDSEWRKRYLMVFKWKSTRDLIHRGLADSVISALPDSEVQDPVKIKRILNDTMAVCIVSYLC